MLSKFLKIIMVITSVSPVFFTLWFNEFSKQWHIIDGLIWLVLSIALIIIAYFILQLSLKKFEKIPIQISSLATADREVLAFIFAYLLPLIDIDYTMMAFVLVLFAFVVFTTHTYHFNHNFRFIWVPLLRSNYNKWDFLCFNVQKTNKKFKPGY